MNSIVNLDDEKIFILKQGHFRFRKKIASFDYDHTMVKPKTKSTFSKGIDDWMWLRDSVKPIIIGYYEKGYSIVIFTNQSQKFKKQQIKYVLKELDIPCIAYACYDKSLKKPSKIMYEMHKGLKKIDTENSFYVGDAAGRHSDWSDSDKLFAENCGLKFYTPEQVFPFEQVSKVIKPQIIPDNITQQELVIMMGYPASGKSTYSGNHFGGLDNYTILHGDILKTEAKLKKALKIAIDSGKSVVIDATNPSKGKRSVFIDIAKGKGLYIRIIHIATFIEESMMRNNDRGDETRVPKIVYYVYRKKYEEPSTDEGVNDVITV